LAERWNGKEWSVQTTPNPGEAQGSWLSEVACSSATFCTAVADYKNSSGVTLPLAESWNGKEWAIQAIQDPSGATYSWLHGVSCASAEACTIVGGYLMEGHSGVVSLIEHWNGKAWTTQTSFSPPWGASASSVMGPYGVSCTAAEACMTVGSYNNTSNVTGPFSELR
jgi:hypothetical protein